MTPPVSERGAGSVVAVRVVPGASAAKVVGLHAHELRVRVCSPPVDGRANEEVVAVVAKALGLRARDVHLIGGQTSRSKQLFVALPVAEVEARLGPWIGPESVPDR